MLRLVDANLNRLAEGLRVLEDIARFLLNDASLSQELKKWRHDLLSSFKGQEKSLLSSRDAPGDVGARTELSGEGGRKDWASLVVANARRAQESLRVLEEFARLPNALVSDWAKFQEARFVLYEIEKKLLSRLLRQEKRARLHGLYVIVDAQFLKGRSELEAARLAIRGGARVIQLRDKKREKGQLLPIAKDMQKLCQEMGAIFIVNDHFDMALLAGADGVHLGQKDLPLPESRLHLPLDMLVGCSNATVEEALRAEAQGADYIAVGSIFPTTSKQDIRMAGLETLRQVKKAVSASVVAIGGINKDNISQVVAAGADCAAVISAVIEADDIEKAARELAQAFEEKK